MLNRLPQKLARTAERPIYKIMFLCEDAAARKKASQLRDVLAGNCQEHIILEAKFFFFAGLCHPGVRETAKREAGYADMFVLSSTSTIGLPFFVQNWLNGLKALKKSMACVQFYAPGFSEPVSHHFMKQWSQQREMEYFSNHHSLARGLNTWFKTRKNTKTVPSQADALAGAESIVGLPRRDLKFVSPLTSESTPQISTNFPGHTIARSRGQMSLFPKNKSSGGWPHGLASGMGATSE